MVGLTNVGPLREQTQSSFDSKESFKFQTLQSCYNKCNEDDNQLRLTNLQLLNASTSIELVCRDSTKLVLRIHYADNESTVERTELSSTNYIYLIKVQESKNRFAERTIYLVNFE